MAGNSSPALPTTRTYPYGYNKHTIFPRSKSILESKQQCADHLLRHGKNCARQLFCPSSDVSSLHCRQRRARSCSDDGGGIEREACVWRLTYRCPPAAYEVRLKARLYIEAVAGLAVGKALPLWHGCFLSSLRQAYAPAYAKSWTRKTTTRLQLRTVMKGSRLLTWRSCRVSRWTSGLCSSGDMGWPETEP